MSINGHKIQIGVQKKVSFCKVYGSIILTAFEYCHRCNLFSDTYDFSPRAGAQIFAKICVGSKCVWKVYSVMYDIEYRNNDKNKNKKKKLKSKISLRIADLELSLIHI